MIEFLFLDLDDTILDFHKAEGIAIRKTFSQLGIDPTDAVCSRYSVINKQCWERLERKELTREEVVVERFAALFRELGSDADPVACARRYETNLSIGHYFLPGAEEALERLSKKYRLYLASNGTAKVQPSASCSNATESTERLSPDAGSCTVCLARSPKAISFIGFCPATATH